jgi:hypothetical protein
MATITTSRLQQHEVQRQRQRHMRRQRLRLRKLQRRRRRQMGRQRHVPAAIHGIAQGGMLPADALFGARHVQVDFCQLGIREMLKVVVARRVQVLHALVPWMQARAITTATTARHWRAVGRMVNARLAQIIANPAFQGPRLGRQCHVHTRCVALAAGATQDIYGMRVHARRVNI